MLSLEALFCHVDDFCQRFEPQGKQQLLGHRLQQRQRSRSLYLSELSELSEIMPICHQPKQPSLLIDEALLAAA